MRNVFLKNSHVCQFFKTFILEGAAGQLQRGRHCYTILLRENAI
jgi:hypothetical protein